MKKILFSAVTVAVAVISGLFVAARASGAEAGFRVETSPDGMMWTMIQDIPEDERYIENEESMQLSYRYDSADDFKTGQVSAIRSLNAGEHYYPYARTGVIPVGEWKVEVPHAYCVNPWLSEEDFGHGITFENQNSCGGSFFSGWMAYCADCKEAILPGNVHLSAEAAKTIRSINVDLGYYYICPCAKPIYRQIEYEDAYDEDGNLIQRPVEYEIVGYTDCGHLEKYWEPVPHICKTISYNRYRVVYGANADGVSGEMEPSFHMYNNAEYFEGKKVTPATRLSLCTYDRSEEGYVFAGWNTKPDGSGKSYSDGEEIYNLTADNYEAGNAESAGTITLYAQWEKVQSTLKIDANGGSYSGENPITKEWGKYGELSPSKLTPPAGYTVSFRTNGGTVNQSIIIGTRSFYGWELQNLQDGSPANGELSGNIYKFTGSDNSIDTVKAIYVPTPIILPIPAKDNYSFGGWYLDSDCTYLAGYGGDPYIPMADVTMYAKWVDLKLTATPDYEANDGKGAVDLTWYQKDATQKTYKIYRSSEGEKDFEQVFLTEDESSITTLNQIYGYEGRTRMITIQSTGFYTLVADGAQGGGFGTYAGGLGGSVSGVFYLTKGEIITFTVGGKNGYNGGGVATDYGNGGGYTIVSSDQKGVLLVAGGGGGATNSQNGLPGGSATGYLVESGSAGQSGMAGGGGGYLGGLAGTRIVHTHSVEGGCYIDASYDVFSSDYAVKPIDRQWKVHEEDEDGNDLLDENYFSRQIGGPGNLIPVNGNTTLDLGAWVYADGHNILDGNSYVEVRNQDGAVIFSATVEQLRAQWNRQFGTHPPYESNRIYTGWNSLPVAYVEIYDEWEQSDGSGGEYDTLLYSDMGYTLYYENGTCQLAKVRLDENHRNPVYYGNYQNEYYPDYDFEYTDLPYRGYDDRPLLFSRRSFWYGTTGAHFRYLIDIPEGTTGIYMYAEGMIDSVWNGGINPIENLTVSFDQIKLSGGLVLKCQEEDINTPAYGGSNYVNPDYALSGVNQEGVKTGDGSASIRAELTGLMEATGMDDVAAPDKEPPYMSEEFTVEASGDNVATVWFETAQDRGTRYYFKAESYSSASGSKICESNIAECLITSGIKGYFYLVDENAGTEIKDGRFILASDDRYITIEIKESIQYLHIAAVDKAGNISDTIHIQIDGEKLPVAWEISTDIVTISSTVGDSDYANVYPAEDNDTYYVKADGGTPFLLSFESHMHGVPREDYQIDCQIFDIDTTGRSQRQGTMLPYTALNFADATLDATLFRHWTEGNTILTDAAYTGAVRSRGADFEEVGYYRAFTLPSELHGKIITVTPVAGATFESTVRYSDWEKDSDNAIRLIGDGEAPVISGLEALEEGKVIDREEGNITLELSATDDLSGVREFYVEIRNMDNYAKKRYLPDEDGVIRINVTEAEYIFSGDFTVTVYAGDNVGNETTVSSSVTEYALLTNVYRMLAPHTPDFKRGESGYLTIETWGYVDRVEVKFPDFLSAYNQTYVYTDAFRYKQEETISFMIPLDVPDDGSYEVTIRAYKGEIMLEDEPVITVNGTVLDELRTRLR